MQLVPHWRAVLRHAWSVRLGIVAGALIGADFVLEAIVGAGSAPPWLLYVAGIVAAAAWIARFVAQPGLHGGDDGE